MTQEQIIEILKQWHEVFHLTEEQYCDLADAILSLPLEVPSDEEIEEFIISHPDNTGNFILGAGISAGFKVGAKWAIEQTIKRNGKE